jgi:probable nitrogen fixation protein
VTDAALMEAPTADAAAFETTFLKTLVRLMRAQDTHGSWDGKSDATILQEFIVTKEQRREIPIICDPDPDVLWRVELFYTALGLATEVKTGLIASPMMKIGHEGFGRVLLTTGRLVVVSKTVRDVHRFGFESYAKLAEAGEKALADAVSIIETYRNVAEA